MLIFDFMSNNLRNINTVFPILRDCENSENTVYEQHSTFSTRAKKIYRIPLLSEKKVKIN